MTTLLKYYKIKTGLQESRQIMYTVKNSATTNSLLSQTMIMKATTIMQHQTVYSNTQKPINIG